MKFASALIACSLILLAGNNNLVDGKVIKTNHGDIIFKDDTEPYDNNFKNVKALEKALETLTEEQKQEYLVKQSYIKDDETHKKYYRQVYEAKNYPTDWWNIPDPDWKDFQDKDKPIFFKEKILSWSKQKNENLSKAQVTAPKK